MNQSTVPFQMYADLVKEAASTADRNVALRLENERMKSIIERQKIIISHLQAEVDELHIN